MKLACRRPAVRAARTHRRTTSAADAAAEQHEPAAGEAPPERGDHQRGPDGGQEVAERLADRRAEDVARGAERVAEDAASLPVGRVAGHEERPARRPITCTTAAAIPTGTASRIARVPESRPTPMAIGASSAAESASTANQALTAPSCVAEGRENFPGRLVEHVRVIEDRAERGERDVREHRRDDQQRGGEPAVHGRSLWSVWLVGDPGDEHAVRVVDEVVARERVDDVALAAQVRGGDGDQLTVARRRRDAPARASSASASGADSAAATRSSGSSLVRALRRSRRSPRRRRTRACGTVPGAAHAATVPSGADTADTALTRRTSRGARDLRPGAGRGPARRRLGRDPGRQDGRVARAARARCRAHVSADRLLDDLWARRADATQHAAGEGRAAAARARRSALIGGRRLPARGRPRAGRCAARAERCRRGGPAPRRGRRARRRRARARPRWRLPRRAAARRGRLGRAAAGPARGGARDSSLETHFAARLRLSEPLIAELEAALATAPYQEGLWELLITALYRAGRQADALAAYQRVRALLIDDLGLEPGPRLRELERQVLEHDPALRAAPAGNLPALQVELVGRDDGARRSWLRCSTHSGSWRSSGPAASARRASRSRPAAPGRGASGSSASRPPRPPTRCSTR